MLRILKRIGQNIYVDGLHLLALCEKLVTEAAEQPAAGDGTPDNPYVMSSPAQWINRWRPAGKEVQETYYKLAGRLILKNKKLYVSDIGPAYLKGASREDTAEKAKAVFLKDTALRPRTLNEYQGFKLPMATVSDAQKEAWLKRNTNNDPTYRSGAQRIVDPGLIYEDSTKTHEQYGGTRPAPWSDIRHSPILASAIRTLLKGQKLSFGGEGGKYDANYSRKQALLPVFTMAIFFAEPARNRRAWPINLMLLDLAQAGTQGYTWDAILWHPEAINPAAHGLVVTPVSGPLGREPSERQIVPITETGKLHLVGGLLPASPTGGGERGKPALYQPPKPLHYRQIERGQVQGPGSLLNIPFDYIHQKEIDVLLRWLLRHPIIRQSWSIFEGGQVPNGAQILDATSVLSARFNANNDVTLRLQAIRTNIAQRIASFDYSL